MRNILLVFLSICFFQGQSQHDYDEQGTIFSNGGDVGVGIGVPQATLDIYKYSSSSLRLSTHNALYNASFQANADATNRFNIKLNGHKIFGHASLAGTTPTYMAGYYGLAFLTTTTTSLTDSKVRMLINNLGNVGIGTLNPGYKLHVKGSARIDSYLTLGTNGENGYTASGLILKSHNDYRGTGTFSRGQTNDWFWGNPYTDHKGTFIIANAPTGSGNALAKKENALFTIKSSGKIGVGTTSPSRLFTISSQGAIPGLRIQNIAGGSVASPSESTMEFGHFNSAYHSGRIKGISYSSNLSYGDLSFEVANNISAPAFSEAIRIKGNTGYVGIGTTSPNSKLDVRGVISIGEEAIGNRFRIYAGGSGSTNQLRIGTDYGHLGDAVVEFYQDYVGGNDQQPGKMIVNGKMGIGIADVPVDYKLAVLGKIITEEVKVKLKSNVWPDFVFGKEYNLPTLEEVESYIHEKGHLRDIPTAAEVGENGILLGEMNSKLLQKIEELTLYQIEANKVMLEMRKELKSVKMELNQLKNK